MLLLCISPKVSVLHTCICRNICNGDGDFLLVGAEVQIRCFHFKICKTAINGNVCAIVWPQVEIMQNSSLLFSFIFFFLLMQLLQCCNWLFEPLPKSFQ